MVTTLLLAGDIASRVLEGLEHHGYPVLFWSLLVNNIGVPVPAESVLLTAAGLAKEGHFRLPLVYLTGVAAAVMGDNAGFLIGRQVGREVLAHRFSLLLTPKRIAGLDRLLARWGAGAIFVVRFVPGVSTVSAVLAGSSDLPWARYLLGNVSGGLAWVAWICTLGYYGSEWGERLKPVWSGVHRATWVTLVVLVVLALAGKVFLRRKRADGSSRN
jgi:membrane protein DedA with SNARE-associated domain